MKHIKWIWNFWGPHRHWIWILLILTFLSSAVTLLLPYFLGIAIDAANKVAGESIRMLNNYPEPIRSWIVALNNWLGEPDPERISVITWKVILILSIVGFSRSLAYLYPGFRAMINAKIGMDIRKYYFSKIIGKGYRFFNKFRTGDLVTRLTDDIDSYPKIAWFACSGVFRALESASKFAFCIAFMIIMNWKLALLSITPLPIMLFIFYKLRLKLTEYSLQRQKMISTTNDGLEAAFSGVRILKAFNGESSQVRSFSKILNTRIGVELQFQRLWFLVWNLYSLISNVGQLIVIVVGGMMVINHTLTVGEFYAFYIYLSLLLQPLIDIPNLFVTSRVAFACIDREMEIESTPGGTENSWTGIKPVPKHSIIEISNAEFSYSDEVEPVLKNINLTLKKGEKAAVVGAVGSGKSTLIKLVAGLYPPASGEILLNGTSISEFDIGAFRSMIGYIPQESTLFSESVADNISFGRGIQLDDIREALSMAQVLKEMESLPKGIDEVLGQKGLTVSGGQKQRLAIARALAGKPEILLMDDCTSALDAENERRFWAMFTEKSPGAACLIVTHRLATARQADVIYVMHEGEIVGRGTHSQLLETCEEYRNFLSRDELRAALKAAKSA